MPHLTVATKEKDLTVLEFLCRRIPAAPSAYLRQLLKKGKIRTAAKPLRAEDPVAAEDILLLPAAGRLLEMLAMGDLGSPVEILYESREILVVDKSAGLAVHAAAGHEEDNLTRRVEEMARRRGEKFRIAPIHRLDLETSGPVLFGKGKKACGELGKLFMDQKVEKLYLALVKGRIDGQGTLVGTVPAKGKEKQAQTAFRSLAASDAATLLELRLLTGRRHQIRRQLADIGHPLFGDLRYGGPCIPGLSRLFLHCRRLAFIDPFSAAPLAIDSPLPRQLVDFAAALNLPATG
ncbi:MAG: RNA pseudouridine synthase [Desulfuromonadaceae bacterium]|nr:RNA pseudouridine synthase [Desulfuromonadaceae bacterium]